MTAVILARNNKVNAGVSNDANEAHWKGSVPKIKKCVYFVLFYLEIY